MTMMEMFEAGYTVTCGTAYGDRVMEDREDVLDAMEDAFVLEEVDEDAKTAYFFYDVFADEEEWGEDL